MKIFTYLFGLTFITLSGAAFAYLLFLNHIPPTWTNAGLVASAILFSLIGNFLASYSDVNVPKAPENFKEG